MSDDLLKVIDVLCVSGRGVVVVTDKLHRNVFADIKHGQPVLFQSPNGKVIASTLQEFEFFGSPFNPNKPFMFVAGSELSKADIEVGSLVTFPR